MILNTRHTGMVVRDLERSIAFYTSLGLMVWKRETETGTYIDTVVGIKDVIVEWAKLVAPDGSVIELLQYHSHPDQTPFSKAPSNKLGCSHISFTVLNVDAALITIQEMGGSILNLPSASPSGIVKVAYAYDPDGILIELVQDLDPNA